MDSLQSSPDPSMLLPGFDPWLSSYLSTMQSRYISEIDSSLKLVVETLDDLRALQVSAQHVNVPLPWREALRVLRAKLESGAADLGLTTVPTAGHCLDPRIHVVESTRHGDAPPETIVEEIRPGYVYEGRVLRPAVVVTIDAEGKPPTNCKSIPLDSKGDSP